MGVKDIKSPRRFGAPAPAATGNPFPTLMSQTTVAARLLKPPRSHRRRRPTTPYAKPHSNPPQLDVLRKSQRRITHSPTPSTA
ncbi:MAG: hypothetical protein QXT13_12910 [Pyrobaculum sp.]